MKLQREDLEDILPLTTAQRGFLFHCRYEPEAALYVGQIGCRLRGPLSAPAFEEAWQHCVDRHAALRACFAWDGLEHPLQVIVRRVRVPFEVQDWRHLAAVDRDAAIEAFEREERRRPFDPRHAPLMRLRLLRLADDEHHFVWTVHHLIVDGWSCGQVLREAAAAYESLARGECPTLPPAARLREYLERLAPPRDDEAKAFWQRYFHNWAGPVRIARDRVAGPDEWSTGDVRQPIAADLVADLHALGRRLRVTPASIVQACWGVLLGRYTNAHDIAFGVTSSGRAGLTDGERTLVGALINTLPVRLRLRADEPFDEWLQAWQEEQHAARRYAQTALTDIPAWIGADARDGLFESVVVSQDFLAEDQPNETTVAASLTPSSVRAVERTNYPLVLKTYFGTPATIALHFDEACFDRATAEGILTHVQRLLRQVTRDPRQRLAALELVDDGERAVLDGWNATETAIPPGAVPDWIATQAARTPDRIAIVAENGERLTYAAVNAMANQVAQLLRARGIGPDDRVAVCLSRTPRVVVALLGVWRAGAAYVPLDPAQPIERIRAVVEHARVSIGLTEDAMARRLPRGCHWLSIDGEAEVTLGSQPAIAPGIVLRPANLAYVIYTSGSTGQPKGVQISHRALANCVTALAARPGLRADDVVLALTTVTFDIAVEELWVPLAVGARIVLVERETVGDRAALASLLQREGVTVVQTVPTVWPRLLDAWPVDRRLTLLTGGEPLPAHLAGQLAARGPTWNLYGPTETTVWSTVWPVTPDRPVRIGTPLANTQVYVLDARMRRVPIGVTGELYIGGEGLARGYWDQPELTARQFVPNPFGPPGSRLYRTGDQARFMPDGLECLGRRDGQVKIRGVRLELGEVEHVLASHPAVAQAVAAVRQLESGPVLVAWYTLARGVGVASVSNSDLRHYAAERLGAALAPSLCVHVESFPRLANGKVDRAALLRELEPAALAPARMEADAPVIDQMRAIWRNVLGVWPTDDAGFFELGGHSLTAGQLAARVADVFGVPISLRDVFESPGLRQLSALVEARLREAAGMVWPPLGPVPRGDRFPLTAAQKRIWLLQQLEPASTHYNLCIAFDLRRSLSLDAFERAMSDVVQRHEGLRTRFAAADAEPFQEILPDVALPITVVDLSQLPEAAKEAEAISVARRVAARPFDLAAPPLLRIAIVRLDTDREWLALALHHIVADGPALGLLLDELAASYQARVSSHPLDLPALRVQGADAAVWEHAWLTSAAYAEQLSAAVKAFQHVRDLPALALPAPVSRRAEDARRGGHLTLALSRQQTNALREIAADEGATMFMALLAVVELLLYRHAGQESFAIGTASAVRPHRELESVVGFFANTLALPADLSGNPTFREVVRRVRRASVDAYRYQHVPFDRLVAATGAGRPSTEMPVFRVFVALDPKPLDSMTAMTAAARDFAAALREVPIDTGIARFDLEFLFAERDGVTAAVRYASRTFSEAIARTLLDRFVHAVDQLVANPEVTALAIALDSTAAPPAMDARPDDDETLVFSFETPSSTAAPAPSLQAH